MWETESANIAGLGGCSPRTPRKQMPRQPHFTWPNGIAPSSPLPMPASPRSSCLNMGSPRISASPASPRCTSPLPGLSPRLSEAEARMEEECSERLFNERVRKQQFENLLGNSTTGGSMHETAASTPVNDITKNSQSELAVNLTHAHGLDRKNRIPTSYATAPSLQRSTIRCVDGWVEQLLHCQPLKAEEVQQLCNLLTDILQSEDNCVAVDVPVTIAGDIHGQFYDLLELFRVGGMPPDINYLFLGDYVDRGFYSIEVFCLVAALKVRYPRNVHLLRGNHESRGITHVYGFYDECLRKYPAESGVWQALTAAFDYLPLCAVVDKAGKGIFCDHGGMSKELMTIDTIQTIDRKREPPSEGGMTDLLWSDPAEVNSGSWDSVYQGENSQSNLDKEGWAPSTRGAGHLWGKMVTDRFLHLNGLKCICRAHQLVAEGVQWCHDDRVCTVFSAPNYCYRCGNKASLMVLDEDEGHRFLKFKHAPERGEITQLGGYLDYFS